MHGKTPLSLAAPQRTNGSIPSIFGGEIGTGMRRVPAEFVTRPGASRRTIAKLPVLLTAPGT